ncbi:MAG: phospholipase D-like domain-containing protein [Bacteroidota bacterium]|jgi:phosphatidylserine/phosphatidylglycerophosphate/cardiolipin synthase-like enzyme
MKLSDLTIDSLKEFVSGDNGLTPSLSGPKILKLFNRVGFKDIYKYEDGGMPGSVSRNQYVFNKLTEINGTKEMRNLLEMVFDPRHFANDTSKDIDAAIEKVNPLIQADGFRFEKIDGNYKIIGADLPEEVQVEIHFEDIQKQIIEELKAAKFTVWIAVAWFTDKVLFEILLEKKKQGVNVQIIVVDDEINAKYGLPYESFFETHRIAPTGRYANIMHHKFCVIDLRTVIHGSYNWTNKAQWNKETISIDISREFAEKFASEFIQLKL